MPPLFLFISLSYARWLHPKILLRGRDQNECVQDVKSGFDKHISSSRAVQPRLISNGIEEEYG